MDIQDITNMAKNGTQIVPQFTPPNGQYLFDNKDNSYKNGYIKDNGDFIYREGGNTYFVDEKTRVNNPRYKLLNGEDLPQFADKKVQNMTMLYNALEALKNRNFQERMYGERYQKIIKDIQKAGLNPYAINFFTPSGGFSGSSASIMSNYQAQQSNINSNVQTKSRSKIESKSQNTNKNAGWMHALQAIGQIITAAVLLLK